MIKEKLEPGTERWLLWQRNVIDKYKDWSNDEIKQDLKAKALPCAVLCQNLQHEFNISSIMRSANSFGIFDFYYYGIRHIDRRGSLGCYHYMNIHCIKEMDEVISLKDKYWFVGLENNINRKSADMRKYSWKPNSLIVIGEEGTGINEELLGLCDELLEIPSFGSIRSLNAASSASIAFYDYVSKISV